MPSTLGDIRKMPFRNGVISYVRCALGSGKPPREIDQVALELLRKNCIRPDSCGSGAPVTSGWIAGRHVFDLDFSHESNSFSRALLAAMRTDSVAVPPALKRAYRAMAEDELRGGSTRDRGLSRIERMDAKEQAERRCIQEIGDGRWRRIAERPVLWDLDENIVLAPVDGDLTFNQLKGVMQETFDCLIERQAAGRRAVFEADAMGHASDLRDATLDGFVAPPAQVATDEEGAPRKITANPEPSWAAGDPLDYFGNVFLLWLWWKCDCDEGLVEIGGPSSESSESSEFSRWRWCAMTQIVGDLPSAALDYRLDPQLIATTPAHPRDQARMLIFHRRESRIEHRRVADLPEYLEPNSKLIVNETRVAPLRFVARRVGDGRETEGLFLGRAAEGRWLALIKGAKRFAIGDELELCPPAGAETSHQDRIKLYGRREMAWEVAFESSSVPSAIWERSGRTPLPPYIVQARNAAGGGEYSDAVDRGEYQTVFARASDLPSCAAPTAGLHFTPELLERIANFGVERIAIELQVGTGTFRPVEVPVLSAHPMHHEHCRISAWNLLRLADNVSDGSLVVGTTSVRFLESLPRPIPEGIIARAKAMVDVGSPEAVAMDFTTNILIAPGFDFRWTHRLLTNFHLPRSTLLALVGALVGLEQLKEIYAVAQRERYRFYSFGDAMLILP